MHIQFHISNACPHTCWPIYYRSTSIHMHIDIVLHANWRSKQVFACAHFQIWCIHEEICKITNSLVDLTQSFTPSWAQTFNMHHYFQELINQEIPHTGAYLHTWSYEHKTQCSHTIRVVYMCHLKSLTLKNSKDTNSTPSSLVQDPNDLTLHSTSTCNFWQQWAHAFNPDLYNVSLNQYVHSQLLYF